MPTPLVLAFVVATAVTVACDAAERSPPPRATDENTGIRVRGNKLVDIATNEIVQLKGVSHAGTEYQCAHNNGIFDGVAPPGPMRAWTINVVRIPLNEDCWLGIGHGINASISGAPYQAAIKGYVDTLLADGLAVILDLHWTAPGATVATGQVAMPDTDHSPAFWTSLATTFSYSQRILFEIFNEPFPGGANHPNNA